MEAGSTPRYERSAIEGHYLPDVYDHEDQAQMSFLEYLLQEPYRTA